MSCSNYSWPSGDHPIELLARKEAIKQLKTIGLDRLGRLAERVKGEGKCTVLTSMTRIGAANVVIFLAFDDVEATRWIARFPLVGRLTDSPDLLAELVESMIATMQFVSDRTSIPIPKIHHWDSTFSNELRRPYVIMDAAKGNSLYELEHVGAFNMEDTVKKLGSFVNQWALYNAELAALRFEQIGSLQRGEDDLYVHRLCSRANVYYSDLMEGDKYRGPFNSVTDYLLSISELKCRALPSATSVLERYTYHDFLRSKLVESMLPYFVNSTLLNGPFVLSHIDLDIQNILVDETNGFKITGVVDWDLAAVVPLQSHLRIPDMLMCDQWTKSRQRGKAISPWQIEFAKKYREHYKSCLKKHLGERQLDYPVDTLLENGYLFSRFERAISENPDDEGFDLLWNHIYGSQLNWKDV